MQGRWGFEVGTQRYGHRCDCLKHRFTAMFTSPADWDRPSVGSTVVNDILIFGGRNWGVSR